MGKQGMSAADWKAEQDAMAALADSESGGFAWGENEFLAGRFDGFEEVEGTGDAEKGVEASTVICITDPVTGLTKKRWTFGLLRKQIEDKAVAEGDVIGVRYLGKQLNKKDNREYHRSSLVTQKELVAKGAAVGQ